MVEGFGQRRGAQVMVDRKQKMKGGARKNFWVHYPMTVFQRGPTS